MALRFAFENVEDSDKDWLTYLRNYHLKVDDILTQSMEEASILIINQVMKDNDGTLVFTATQQKRAGVMFDLFSQPEQKRRRNKRKRFVLGTK